MAKQGIMNSVESKCGKQAEKLSQKRQLTKDPKKQVGNYWLDVAEKHPDRKRAHAGQAGEGLLLPLCCHSKFIEYRTFERVRVLAPCPEVPRVSNVKALLWTLLPTIRVIFKQVISPLQSSFSAST